MDRKTRFIPEEKQLILTIQDGLTQIRLSNLSSEQTKLFVSCDFLQDINCIEDPIPFSQCILPGYILQSWYHPYHMHVC